MTLRNRLDVGVPNARRKLILVSVYASVVGMGLSSLTKPNRFAEVTSFSTMAQTMPQGSVALSNDFAEQSKPGAIKSQTWIRRLGIGSGKGYPDSGQCTNDYTRDE